MPSTYTNITLKGPSQSDVADWLKKAGRRAYVSPTDGGMTVVFDMECEGQDTEVLDALAQGLSASFSCSAYAVLDHEDAVLYCLLYMGGELVDEYVSAPDAFDMDAEEAAAVSGNAGALCKAFGMEGALAALKGVLADRDTYTAEYERHRDIADTLGLPRIAVNLGYNYIAMSKVPERIEKAGLLKVG